MGTGVALVLGSLVTSVTMASGNDAAPVPATEEVGLNGRPNLITPGFPQNGPSPSKTSRPPVQEHAPELVPIAERPRETRPTPTAKPSPTPSKPPAQPSVQPWPGSSGSASDWQEYCQNGGCSYYGYYYYGDPYGYSDGHHHDGHDGGYGGYGGYGGGGRR